MPRLKMPVKTVTVRFDEDGYAGFRCERRLNLTLGLLRRMQDAEGEEAARAAYLEVFPSWNFCDEVGQEIPHTVEGFDLIPAELFEAMLRRGFEAVKEAALSKKAGETSSSAEAAAGT